LKYEIKLYLYCNIFHFGLYKADFARPTDAAAHCCSNEHSDMYSDWDTVIGANFRSNRTAYSNTFWKSIESADSRAVKPTDVEAIGPSNLSAHG